MPDAQAYPKPRLAVVNDGPAARIYPSLSPGPWAALTVAPTPCGAIVLEDARGAIIGWATDRAGHTSEMTLPDGRAPAGIAINARAMAEARELLAIAAELVAIEPVITARLMVRGVDPDPALSLAAEKARGVLNRVYAGVPRR